MVGKIIHLVGQKPITQTGGRCHIDVLAPHTKPEVRGEEEVSALKPNVGQMV